MIISQGDSLLADYLQAQAESPAVMAGLVFIFGIKNPHCSAMRALIDFESKHPNIAARYFDLSFASKVDMSKSPFTSTDIIHCHRSVDKCKNAVYTDPVTKQLTSKEVKNGKQKA